jgi:hypothetical protein
MQDTVFRPRYSFKSFWDVIILSLLLMFALLFSFLKLGFTLTNMLGSICLIFFLGWISHFLIRRIVFSISSFCIEKYFWPSKTIEYSDVIDLGKTKIKTRRGEVRFTGMSNASELLSRFTKLIEQGKIKKSQIENKVVTQEIIFRKSIIPSLVISSLLWGVGLYFWPDYSSSFISAGILLFIIFICVILVIEWMIKKAS